MLLIRVVNAQFNYKVGLPEEFADSASTLLRPWSIKNMSGKFYDLQACRGKGKVLMCCWMDKDSLFFQRSSDYGKQWLREKQAVCAVKNAVLSKLPGSVYRGYPSLACDTGSTQFNGRIYISWSDEKHGANNKNVFLVYSDDEGAHWTEPILVSYRPNHKHQFFPRLAVDSKTGMLYLAYFDSQNSANGLQTDVYLAKSENGGLKFDYVKVNSTSIRLVQGWQPKLSCWLDDSMRIRINWVQPWILSKCRLVQASSSLNHIPPSKAEQLQINKTFAYGKLMELPFDIPLEGKVSAILTKATEPAFEKVVLMNKAFKAGKNSLNLNMQKMKLPPDHYILTLYYRGENVFSWILTE